jgi:hypothetical protein
MPLTFWGDVNMHATHQPIQLAGIPAAPAAADALGENELHGADRELSFDSCVPRNLVHKQAVAEVFLTDVLARDRDRFAVAAQWPRDHVFFQPGADGCGDPLLWIETVRQISIYLSHRFYGVPHGNQFILIDTGFVIDDPQPPRPSAAPLAVTLDVGVDVQAQDARRLAASLEAVVSIGGVRRGTATLTWQAVDRRRYDTLRRRRGGAPVMSGTGADRSALVPSAVPVLPAAVGRRHEANVLLAAPPGDGDRWQLQLDDSHLVFFDHALDHVPGMALVEAFRQATALASSRQGAPDPAPRLWALTSGRLAFHSFAELDAPATVDATRADEAEPAADGERAFEVAATQEGRSLATGRLTGRALPVAGHRPRTLTSAGGAA